MTKWGDHFGKELGNVFIIESKKFFFPHAHNEQKILYCSNDDSKTGFDFKERLMWEDEEKTLISSQKYSLAFSFEQQRE